MQLPPKKLPKHNRNVLHCSNKKDVKMQQLFNAFRGRVETNLSKTKKRLDELQSELSTNTKITNDFAPVILNAKTVITSIKNEEFKELQEEIEGLTFSDPPAKHFMLRRKLKKLQRELDDIAEKDVFEAEDEYASVIEDWNKRKKRHRGKINPNKKI